MTQKWTPPSWWYHDRRPPNDTAYFENLTRCIFQAGLNWEVISSKWPNFANAFDGFDFLKIAKYGSEDIMRLKNDQGIVRNGAKILSTIHNAREFERIVAQYGSFQNWLNGLDKSDNYALVIREIKGRFKHTGEMTTRIFLHSVGEPLKVDKSLHAKNGGR